MRKKREETVDWFAERVKRKLRMNEHKGSWLGYSRRQLDALLVREVSELLAAPDGEELIDEAADVAAYAMMLADKAR